MVSGGGGDILVIVVVVVVFVVACMIDILKGFLTPDRKPACLCKKDLREHFKFEGHVTA